MAGYRLNILIFMLFILIFNIIFVMRTKSLIYKVFLFYGAHLYLRRATDLVADPFPHIALVI